MIHTDPSPPNPPFDITPEDPGSDRVYVCYESMNLSAGAWGQKKKSHYYPLFVSERDNGSLEMRVLVGMGSKEPEPYLEREVQVVHVPDKSTYIKIRTATPADAIDPKSYPIREGATPAYEWTDENN